MTGIITLLAEPRNKNMTTITIINASITTFTTSLIELFIKIVLSYATLSFIWAGSCFLKEGIMFLSFFTTVSGFAVGVVNIPITTAFFPFIIFPAL